MSSAHGKSGSSCRNKEERVCAAVSQRRPLHINGIMVVNYETKL